MGVAGEHFIAERKAIQGDDQRNADLFTVGPVIARVATLGERVGRCLAFEVGTGHVVQQHFVLDGKELATALRQMRFNGRLVHQQLIERTV